MNRQDLHGNRPNRRFGTRLLESLENRRLLSTTSTPQISIRETPNSPTTTMLTITGTKKNDNIAISDNGTGTAGNIDVSYSGAVVGAYVSKGAVSQIFVATGAGNDQVTYELDGDLQPGVFETVSVGSNLKKSGGSVQFTENILGKVLDGASLTVLGYPNQSKPTTMIVNDPGEIDGSLGTGITFPGTNPQAAGGPEVFQFTSTAAIGPDGQISTGLNGSKRNDRASVSYKGTNNGELDITEIGNGGNDQLEADVTMVAGSTGTVGQGMFPSYLRTSGKKDRLTFTITRGNDFTSTNGIYAQIFDTSKKDVSLHTANVTAYTKGMDTILSI